MGILVTVVAVTLSQHLRSAASRDTVVILDNLCGNQAQLILQ